MPGFSQDSSRVLRNSGRVLLADTDKPSLYLVYEWWDTMIEKVKATIYRKEHKQLHEQSDFFDVVYHILVERWTKSSTPLHYFAHCLNPRFKSPKWLQEDPSLVAPHQDVEITRDRKKCLEKYFSDDRATRDINVEYASFSMCLDDFGAIDAMNDRKSLSYKEGVTQMWDIGGDGFDSLGEEGVGMLEIANLSLDKPSLEVALFTREDITNIIVD
ncbi:unnamed protein product [Prunus armeniaca]